MNLLTQTEDKLEVLPTREKFPRADWWDYSGNDFPYRRFQRWLESRVGNNIDKVIHEYVHLDWIPTEYRHGHYLKDYIEMDTFMDKGKVCYYSNYYHWDRRLFYYIEEYGQKVIYMHPMTKLLCIHIPPTRKSFNKQCQEARDARCRILGEYWQLYKIKGIWFEIKAKIIREKSNLGPHDIILETVRGFMPSFEVTVKRQLNGKELKKLGLHND